MKYCLLIITHIHPFAYNFTYNIHTILNWYPKKVIKNINNNVTMAMAVHSKVLLNNLLFLKKIIFLKLQKDFAWTNLVVA